MPYMLVGVNLPPTHFGMAASAFVELFLGLAFLLRWLVKPKDGLSIYLFLFPLLAIPALGNAGNLSFSLTLTLIVITGAGFYGFWLDNMPAQLQRRVPQVAFGVWLGLGFFIKFYESAVLHEPWWIQRSGGIWAANHGYGVLLLLLPFVRSRILLWASVLYVVTSNSRGVYVTTIVLALGYVGIGYWKAVSKGLIVTAVGVVIALASLSPDIRQPVIDFATERFFSQGASVDQGAKRVLASRVGSDERWIIYDAAKRLAPRTSYIGVGIGGFQYGLPLLGWSPDYSNAHNVYLTSWAEGGAPFTLAFGVLLAFGLVMALRFDRRVFVTLVAWLIYALFNGETWESSRVGTAGDYLTIVFVIAYLAWLRREHASALVATAVPQPVACST